MLITGCIAILLLVPVVTPVVLCMLPMRVKLNYCIP